MRLTDDRYASEKRQFELALRMIGHEARTRTIKECTGLSDDRIRKLYATYFLGRTDVKRRRGKSPRQVQHYVRNPDHQLQATTLVALFCAGFLIRIDNDNDNKVHACWPRPDVEFGHRLCRAYETYLVLHEDAALNFEWTWNLLQCISYNDELYLAVCDGCAARYVQDAYAIDKRCCPTCEIASASGKLDAE